MTLSCSFARSPALLSPVSLGSSSELAAQTVPESAVCFPLAHISALLHYVFMTRRLIDFNESTPDVKATTVLWKS
jgi:hypothetical protein